jgi:hypothetical protein
MYPVRGGFVFNITGPSHDSFHVEGQGQGEEARARMVCMMILGVMPSEGLGEALDTLKDLFEFYAAPPERMLPSPQLMEMDALVTSVE